MSIKKKTMNMPRPVCLINNTEDGGLCLCKEGKDILEQIKQPVVVVAVVGLYRTGKSYLMNRLAGKQKNVALGSTFESKTKGIWMWCLTHPRKEDHTLVLLDTEGLGDVDKGDEKHDIWIFSLAVLLSSTLVYNSLAVIDNTALEKLQYITKLTEHIDVRSNTVDGKESYSKSTEFMRVFPSFVWTVRDFTLDLELDGKTITADQYLENALKLKKDDAGTSSIANYNKIRNSLRDFFAVRKCFVFERPGNKQTMKKMEELTDDDLEEDFVEQANKFCTYIYTNSRVKTIKGGREVTGSMLATLAQTYVVAISSGQVPSLDNAAESLAKIQNNRAVKEAVEFYRSGMTKKVRFPTETQQELSDIHAGVEKEAISIFIRGSFNDQDQKYQKQLVERLMKIYEEFVKQNLEESCKACRSIITRVFGPLDEAVKEGTYMQVGGYLQYCSALEKAVQQYRSEKGHGLMLEEVLGNYLAEKSEVGQNILLADRSINEAEKKTEEEKHKKEASELQNRLLEEQNKMMQQLIQDQKESHKEHVELLKEKMQEERERSKEEIRRLQQALHQERLMKTYEEFVKQNLEESRKACRSIITRVFGPLDEAVKEGTYMQVGGYLQYCSALEKAVQQYRSEKGHGLMLEEVLGNYLAEKSEVKQNILAADLFLGEAEKKTEEEKRKKEASELQNRLLEQQQKIQEQLIQDQQKSRKEHDEQLKKKMEDESERNNEEIRQLRKALQEEQMRKMQEGFMAESRAMQKDIEMLRNNQQCSVM